MPVREKRPSEPAPGQHVPFSGLVEAHTPGESRALAPVALKGTGETDSPLEERRFEPLVPLATVSPDFRETGRSRNALGDVPEDPIASREVTFSAAFSAITMPLVL